MNLLELSGGGVGQHIYKFISHPWTTFKMLGHIPHPTLHPHLPPIHPTDGISEDNIQIRLPPPTVGRCGNAHHLSNTATHLGSFLPSSRSSSPSRSSTLLPFLKLAKDRSISPEPVSAEEAAEFENTLTGDKPFQTGVETKPGKLASWFSGSSEPVNITLIPSPVNEKHDPFFDCAEMERGSNRSSMSQERDSMTKIPQSRLPKNSSGLSITAKDLAGSNKFTFWRSRPTTTPEKSNVVEDEFTKLDIQSALFPSGTTGEASADEFMLLQANAENTILRLQSAYQKSLHSFREMTSQRNVLGDELEAAQTRSEHLKLQLANMAAQSVRQKWALQSMAEELAVMRRKMSEDAEFRSKSLRIVVNDSSDADDAGSVRNDDRGRKRHSGESFASEESSSESIFSEAPLGACTPISAADTSPDVYETPTFDNMRMQPVKECQNCYGVRRSEAWDVVHVLKEESRALKARIAQCESANEDALSLLEIVSTIR